MFLHFPHIYANSFKLISFTYMKMTEHLFLFSFFLFFSITLPAARINLLFKFQRYILVSSA